MPAHATSHRLRLPQQVVNLHRTNVTPEGQEQLIEHLCATCKHSGRTAFLGTDAQASNHGEAVAQPSACTKSSRGAAGPRAAAVRGLACTLTSPTLTDTRCVVPQVAACAALLQCLREEAEAARLKHLLANTSNAAKALYTSLCNKPTPAEVRRPGGALHARPTPRQQTCCWHATIAVCSRAGTPSPPLPDHPPPVTVMPQCPPPPPRPTHGSGCALNLVDGWPHPAPQRGHPSICHSASQPARRPHWGPGDVVPSRPLPATGPAAAAGPAGQQHPGGRPHQAQPQARGCGNPRCPRPGALRRHCASSSNSGRSQRGGFTCSRGGGASAAQP